MIFRTVFFSWVFFFMAVLPSWAVLPDEILADPLLESRARAITRDLRCVVCQGQDIDDSNAPLAGDLRKLVRARIKAGDTDEAVVAYVHDRYGDYVLMRPPVSSRTALLWAGPFLVLVAGFFMVARFVRRARKDGAA